MAITVVIGIAVLAFILFVTTWLGGPFFVKPFADPIARKTMAALATLVVWLAGIAASFLPQQRTRVGLACGIAATLIYAVGLMTAHA